MITKQIKMMTDIKSPGVDGIPRKLFKEIVEQSSTLAKVFDFHPRRGNSSFRMERSKHYAVI